MKPHRLFKFALIGCVGFIIDASTFAIAHHLMSLDLMMARLLAFMVAVSSNWFGNRWFTFKECEKQQAFKQWQKFFVVACISAIPNFLVFNVTAKLIVSPPVSLYLALALGVLAGMVSNFLLSQKVVFATQ